MRVIEVLEGYNDWDMNIPSNANREMGRWGASDRDFKRREMEHELAHEDEWNRREQGRLQQVRYGVSINGKTWKKDGQPVMFFVADKAQAAAQKIRERMLQRGQPGEVKIVALQ